MVRATGIGGVGGCEDVGVDVGKSEGEDLGVTVGPGPRAGLVKTADEDVGPV